MVKTREQFSEDVQLGNSWEAKLYDVLQEYLPGLSEPRPAVLVDGLAVGGFQYTPDMTVPARVLGDEGHCSFRPSVEAKVRLGRGFDFTCADDFPFPDVIVTEVYKTAPPHIAVDDYLALPIEEQKSRMRPFHSYWIASTSMRHCLVVLPASKRLWFQRTQYSPKDRRQARNWLCPLRQAGGRPAVLFGEFPKDVPHLLTHL